MMVGLPRSLARHIAAYFGAFLFGAVVSAVVCAVIVSAKEYDPAPSWSTEAASGMWLMMCEVIAMPAGGFFILPLFYLLRRRSPLLATWFAGTGYALGAALFALILSLWLRVAK